MAYIKNSISIEFESDKALTEAEIDNLKAVLGLQIEEPQDLDGNEEEWAAKNITINHGAIVREGQKMNYQEYSEVLTIQLKRSEILTLAVACKRAGEMGLMQELLNMAKMKEESK